MHTESSEPRAAAGSRLQRAIVLELLSDDGRQKFSRIELEEQLGAQPVDLEAALSGLHAAGVLCLGEQDVWASAATCRLDELELIGI
jgi:hypothetical protein